MRQLITVATFNERAPAEAVAARLKAEGFHAEVFDESSAQQIMFFTGTPKAHMRVRVPKDDGERAEAFLRDWDDPDGANRAAIVCPECGSSRIEYPQFSRRSGMSVFFALLATIGFLDRQFFCRNCHFSWPEKPVEAPNLDVLNWPKK